MNIPTVDHPDFGVLRWDEGRGRYATIVGEGAQTFELGFQESDSDLLANLLEAAASLWCAQEEWLARWRKSCFDYYAQNLKDEWYEGDEPLDEETFNAKIGQPAGIEFSWNKSKLQYMITGMNDDLVADHVLEAHGTGLTPDEICLT